jgi:hypothetical protein
MSRGAVQQAVLDYLAAQGRSPWPEWRRVTDVAAGIYHRQLAADTVRVRRAVARLAEDSEVDVRRRTVFRNLVPVGQRVYLVRLKLTAHEQAAKAAVRAAGLQELRQDWRTNGAISRASH